MDERNELFREMKNFRFLKRTKKMNCLKLFEQTWKHYRFLLNEQIFQKICQKIPELAIFWNKVFKKNCFFFTERLIPLKERFNWMIVQGENERNRRKMKDNLKSSHNFKCKKRTNEWSMKDERTKLKNSNVPICN